MKWWKRRSRASYSHDRAHNRESSIATSHISCIDIIRRNPSRRAAPAPKCNGCSSCGQRLIARLAFAMILGVSHAQIVGAEALGENEVFGELQILTKEGPLLIEAAIATGDANARPVPLRLIVDTGATVTFFDHRHAALLGPPTREVVGSLASGAAKMELHNAPKLAIGPLRLQSEVDVACIDLSSLSVALGEPVDGLLGMDILRKLVFAIDFDRRLMTLRRSADPAWGEAIPLFWRESVVRNCPFVRAAIGDASDLEFLLDTGAIWPTAGSLRASVYDDLVKAGDLRSSVDGLSSFSLLTPTRNIAITQARATVLTLDRHSHKDVVFIRMQSFPSCLSLGYLSRYHVGFDFPNSAMYLRPATSYGRRDVSDRVGISLVRAQGAVKVRGVTAGMPASAAGLKTSDIIVSIDGASTKDMPVLRAWQCLSRGGRHALVVVRDGDRVQLLLEIPSLGKNGGNKRPADDDGEVLPCGN